MTYAELNRRADQLAHRTTGVWASALRF
jgi:hypothetical protein